MSKNSRRGAFRVENSPRDERFFTPRAQASSGRSLTDSLADFGTPRSSREEGLSSRSFQASSSSESEFITPRLSSNEFPQKENTFCQRGNQYHRGRRTYPPLSYRSHDNFVHQSRPPLHYKDKADGSLNQRFNENSHNENKMAVTANLHGVDDIFSLARHSRFDAVHDLLLRGVPANVCDQNGNTLLSIACQNGNKRIAKLALRYGADINAVNVSFHKQDMLYV